MSVFQKVELQIQQESVVLGEPAKVMLVNTQGNVVAEVIAIIEKRPGADGRQYPCVKLEAVVR
jgi:hypothetical protein